MRSTLFAPILMAVATLTAPSHAEPVDEIQRYAVIDFPKTQRGCQYEADNLAAVLAKRTGVQIYKAQCRTEWRDSYYIEVFYLAALPLNKVTTAVYDPTTYNSGIYTDLASCHADLPRQIELFKAATGLEPVVHYCSHENSAQTFDVELRIEGFGAPVLAPVSFSDNVFGYPSGNVLLLSQQIQANLRQLGVKVYGAAVSNEIMQARLTVQYYSDRELPMAVIHPWAFGTVAGCEAHIPEITRIYGEIGQSVVTAFCARKELSSAAELHVMTYGFSGDYVEEILDVDYATYQECVAEQPKAAAYFKSRYPDREIVGHICAAQAYAGGYRSFIYGK